MISSAASRRQTVLNLSPNSAAYYLGDFDHQVKQLISDNNYKAMIIIIELL